MQAQEKLGIKDSKAAFFADTKKSVRRSFLSLVVVVGGALEPADLALDVPQQARELARDDLIEVLTGASPHRCRELARNGG